MIIETLAADAAVFVIEKGAHWEMESEANEVIAKVQALVKTKYAGDYMAAFKAYDLDRNGKLGHKDVSKLLEDAGVGNWLTRGVWANGVISHLDLDHDGAVSIPEIAFALAQGVATAAFPAATTPTPAPK